MSKNNFKKLIESNSARDQKRSEIQTDRAQISIKPSNLIFSISEDKKLKLVGLKFISMGVPKIDKMHLAAKKVHSICANESWAMIGYHC